MASYFRTVPVFVYEVRNETPMSPVDIQLISNIINQDINSLFTNLLNRIEESRREIITNEQFNSLKSINCIKECPICFLEKDENIELKCNHTFCKSCIKRWLTEKGDTCPICREKAI